MGCQGSKAARPSAPTPPTKTLLASNASSPKDVNMDHSKAGSEPVAQLPSNAIEAHDAGLAASMSTSQGLKEHNQQRKKSFRRELTHCTDNKQLDIMVMEFSSHDSTLGNAIGMNSKETHWKVGYARGAAPIDIKMHVQEHKLHCHEVKIYSDGQSIFQGAGPHAKAKLAEDFVYQWPFRASIYGLNEENYFEVRPSHLPSETWFPATIKRQREDGLFEVIALEPNGRGGLSEVRYPAVEKSHLRDAATRKPLPVPEKSLTLQVPKQDPAHAVLSVDGEPVTHHFGRLSPPTGTAPSQELSFQVSKDRSTVTANVGHSVLDHFVSGEVRSVKSDLERLRHSWTFQLGPFAQHTVEVTKKHTLGKVVTLLVDGTVLVEASAVEMGCQSNEWHCDFRFIGERVLDFEVFKTNKEGTPLDDTDHVKERRRYVHECSVDIPNDWDFRNARLCIDGMFFTELPVKSAQHEEKALAMEPRALMHTYGITTPYKVDLTAPSTFAVLAQEAAGGLFSSWCNTATVVRGNSIVIDDVGAATQQHAASI